MTTGASSLLDKQFLIFSGKGGVGKSTVTAAAAVAAARRGRRVLIVEIGEQERIPSIFAAPKAGYQGGKVYENRAGGGPPIWSMCVTAREALHEFAVRSVKFEMVYSAIFENRVMRSFTAAAPGLDELVIIGKIDFLHRDAVEAPKTRRFDTILLDAPATGHGLALFKVPHTAMTMVKMGPLYSKTERMWRLLTDPARTALNIVTLPEDMSVNEAIELHHAAGSLGLPAGKLVVNGVYPDLFEGHGDDLRRMRERAVPADGLRGRVALTALDSALATAARHDAHEAMIETLASAVPRERVTLPWIDRPRLGPEDIEALADRLAAF